MSNFFNRPVCFGLKWKMMMMMKFTFSTADQMTIVIVAWTNFSFKKESLSNGVVHLEVWKTVIVKITNENSEELIAVLGKSSPAVVNIYNKNLCEHLLVANLSRKMFVYSKNIFNKFVCAETKVSLLYFCMQ